MTRAAFTVILVTALALHAAAQAPRDAARTAASRPSTISGRVVDASTGAAVANVRIAVTPSVPGASVTLTDADGRFSFTSPSPRATLSADKAGYATADVTATAAAPVDVRLARGAAIEGRVVDGSGEPAVNMPVRLRAASGRPFARVVQTDDRGDYRIGGLYPGAYIVSTRTVAFSGPGAGARLLEGDGQRVEVERGEVRSDVDFAVPGGAFESQGLVVALAYDNSAPAPVGTGGIEGTVFTTDGRPIVHAAVQLVPAPPAARYAYANSRATTDANGRFALADLAPGNYTVFATKAGYTSPRVATATTSVRNGATASVALRFDPMSAIEGSVSDENGDPMQGVSVQAMQVRYERGARRLVPAGDSRVTDDLGRFRLFGLKPGSYVVMASGSPAFGQASSELPGYGRTFYPGTTDASQAQFVSVAGADTIGGINLPLMRERTALVSGRLLDSAGEPSTGGRVSLVTTMRSGAATIAPMGARIGQDGTFDFASVLPGEYVIAADRGRRTSATEGEFGSMTVAVGGRDVTGLVLQTLPGSTITGRIELDSASGRKLPSLAGLEIRPIPVDFDAAPNDVATADIHADGSFIMQGVSGIRRIELTQAPGGWMLKEVRAAGIDITDRPMQFGRPAQSRNDIEIVLTDRVSAVAGTVRDANGSPVPKVRVIVFPTARDLRYPGSRYLAQAMTSATGAYSITRLPAGSYYVAAIPQSGDDPDGWQDPQVLESFTPIAQSAVVRDGETTTVDLQQTR